MGEHICFRRNERLATINPYWRGNPMVKGRFFNRQHRFRPGMGSVLKWRLSPNPQRKEKRTVKWEPRVNYLRSLDAVTGNSLIWLWHKSFFLQLAGSVGCLLKSNPQMKLFCGLGTGELIKSWFPEIEMVEAGWYQQIMDEGLKITFLPAQHWSKRSVRDGGQRLWGAFMIQGDGMSVYYSGDTGYSQHFSEIPELFGAPDYALVGIGAYKPRWFMRPNHISPHEALTASQEMQAGLTIPMHYGTFDLSDEPLHDPPQVFAAEAKKRKVNVVIPALGEVVKLKRQK